MKYYQNDTGDRPRPTDAQVRRGARKRILRRRINALIILLLIAGALAAFYFAVGKTLIVNYSKQQLAESTDEVAGTKAAVGLFRRESVRKAKEEFDENK